jgi:hypothetical protein
MIAGVNKAVRKTREKDIKLQDGQEKGKKSQINLVMQYKIDTTGTETARRCRCVGSGTRKNHGPATTLDYSQSSWT